MSSCSQFNALFNFDHLETALINFRSQWAAVQFSVDAELHHTLGKLILQLDHWSCLREILIYIRKCFKIDAEKMQNLESLVIKMEAASDEIAKDLKIARAKNFIRERPGKAVDVLHLLEKKIEIFKPEIGQVLHYLVSVTSLEFHSSLGLDHLSQLDRSLRSAQGILRYIWAFVDEDQEEQIDALETKVSSLRSFLLGVLEFEFRSSSDPVIDNFFSHVASLAVRIAYQSYHYWIKKTDETIAQISITSFDLLNPQPEIDPTTPELLESNLKSLQREIDPTSPEFWESTIKFLTSINNIAGGQHQGLAHSFLCYLIHWEPDRDVFPLLKSLVTFAINEPEESSEDVQNFSAEIKALLLLALSTNLEWLSLCICLLNVEDFIKEQLMSSSTTFLKDQKQILGLTKILNLVQEKIADGKEIVDLVEDLSHWTKKVEYLYQSFHGKRVTQEGVRVSLFISLLEVVFTKAESYALKLLENDASLAAFGKDQIETINKGLKLFEAFIRSQQIETTKDIKPIIIQFEVAARSVTTLYYSFLIEQTTEEMIPRRIVLFSDLLNKMKVIKSELRETLPQFQRSNFPKTDGMSFIDFLLGNIRELHRHDPKSIAVVKHHFEYILLNLEFFRSFLVKILEQDAQQSDLKDLGEHITSVAYEVEYVLDSIEAGIGAHWQHVFWIHDLLEEIKSIKMKATGINLGKSCGARVHNVTKIPSPMLMQARTPKTDENVVCLNDQMEDIIDRLTRGSSQRDVVSIIGMPGIGKTTLAKEVYEHLKVTHYFHVRAWCSVSQVYQKRELLLEILNGIGGLTDDIHQMTDEDLDLKLYQRLKAKKYLIVMDDVWDTKAWIDLERSFPNDDNGSRILITSRVALEAKLNSNAYNLRLLSDDESWKLLQMKIFHGARCPEKLLKVGKDIAKNCNGLPLSIVAIAGILERTEKKQEVWKTIAESLSSLIIGDPQTRCMDILQLSYKQLPGYLKPCFLYIGAFLDDKDVPICKLMRLWIAEGFIQKNKLEGLEDLAEDYLMDLIGRSLVTVSRKRSNGKVKACRVHDLLRKLCLSKAKEENFLQLITRYDEPYTSFDDVDAGSDFYDYHPSNPVSYEKHRLFFRLKRKHFVNSSPSGQHTRSLIFFATADTYPRRPYDISFISQHFKLLRVLDLESINIGMSFPKGLESLIQLRYLAVSGDMDSVPPVIANLWKLETFIVKALGGKVILPNTIWCMTSLRHVHVNDRVVFNLEDELESSSKLANFVTFSSPSFSYGKDTDKILSMLSNLHKLGCIFLESWDSSKKCNQFPGLELLTQLESLKIFYIGKALHPGEFSFPKNLKKLTLSNFRLPWDHISAIGGLEHLEVLKLVARAFEGRQWEMKEGEFLKLKFLKLDTLNIAQWNALGEHLPRLQHLVLRNCKDLEEVPYGLVEIATLEIIEVQFCGQSTEESTTTIADEEIEGLKIFINQSLHV